MKILAIETSCDDTSVALIKAQKKRVSFNVLSNIVSSQIEIHKKWGGVYPILAKREHKKNLIPVLEKALKKAKEFKSSKNNISNIQSKTIKEILNRDPELLENFLKTIPKIKKPNINAIAVTTGPGLEPCLWMGINFARALSYLWQIPLIPTNHIEAHIYASYPNKEISFPAICLIVSGGHTQLILMKNHNQYEIIGETRDDAAGECLDKIARILGLSYPGGPIIAKRAKQTKTIEIQLPRPMIHSKDYDFSFSGLKTAVLYDFKKRNPKTKKSKEYINQMCYESQQAVIDVLIHKTIKAAKTWRAKTIILGGGVTANKELRKQIRSSIKKSLPNTALQLPKPQYSTDNAVMVAIASYFNHKEKNWRTVKAQANLRIGK